MRAFLVLFAVLFAFWVGLSDQYRPLFLAIGAVSAALVAALTHDLVADAADLGDVRLRSLPLRVWRFLSYLGWLARSILVASVQIAAIVVHPRMPLEPAVVRFSAELDNRLARTMVANTITMIPGTLTIDLTEDHYVVHTFVPSAADDLVSGELQRRIGGIFLEDPAPPAEVSWEPPREVAR